MLVRHDVPLEQELDDLGPKRRGTPERDLQRVVVKWLRAVMPGAVVMAAVNEQRGAGKTAVQRMRFGAARKASGVLSGAPDLTIVWNGSVVFAELKAPGGVVSEAQQRVHADLRANGQAVVIADSIESLRLGLREAGIATREAADAPVAVAKVRRAKSKVPADAVPF